MVVAVVLLSMESALTQIIIFLYLIYRKHYVENQMST